MLKLKGQNMYNQLLLYVDLFIFYALTWPDKKEKKNTNQSISKNEKLKDEHFEMARTRNCVECGSDEEMRWLALLPSGNLRTNLL